MFHLHELISEAGNSLGRDILVIGDVMLDGYIFGEANRISPEAPVLIVKKQKNTYVLGGAGNVAGNIAGLGLNCTICGITGDDFAGTKLSEALGQKNISNKLLKTTTRRTTIKSRVMAAGQQVVRIDDEEEATMSSELELLFLRAILKEIKRKPSVIIISDYNKGTLSENVCQTIIENAAKLSIPVIIDPKGVNYKKYRGAHTITPNLNELKEILLAEYNYDVGAKDITECINVIKSVRLDLDIDRFVVTLGKHGILNVPASGDCKLFPASESSVIDVSGAGDTVVASLAYAYASSHYGESAIELANICAGIVVKQLGTATIRLSDIDVALKKLEKSGMLLSLASLDHFVSYYRKIRKKIVFTNGCFDLLHVGHISYLVKAKEKGDILIVGINSDTSVTNLKGHGRPINSAMDRAQMLMALQCVDAVIIFEEQTPEKLINKIVPDVLVKGSDYSIDNIIGADFVRDNGGQTIIVPFIEGKSTTSIINRIIDLND
jgi:D-beta-D-heptose 7-phosphate kinase / D-beta-D-heptose 1-phosphate adenosyltransferase